jgi:hypothetical protein
MKGVAGLTRRRAPDLGAETERTATGGARPPVEFDLVEANLRGDAGRPESWEVAPVNGW